MQQEHMLEKKDLEDIADLMTEIVRPVKEDLTDLKERMYRVEDHLETLGGSLSLFRQEFDSFQGYIHETYRVQNQRVRNIEDAILSSWRPQ